MPVLGPEDINLKSFDILDKLIAQTFNAPDTAAKVSKF
ncbi:hypothetical protein SDC9_148368 [bioreactor metagenome]|uniref:Uncharacterized protein n=1 Tax=bioreactor metagenome TaxID=1076179 RepID=A0A645EIR9_9ZZZZ